VEGKNREETNCGRFTDSSTNVGTFISFTVTQYTVELKQTIKNSSDFYLII
jgi:hypothetical protein